MTAAIMIPMRYLAPIACAVFVLLAVACGGVEEALPEEEVLPGESLSLEEYLRALDSARERADARFLDDPTDGDLASEEGQQYLRNNQSIISDFIADVEALSPPPAVADAHTRLLDAMSQSLDYLEDVLARAAAAKTPEERQSLNAAFLEEARAGEADEQFTSACSELQQAADAAAIEVNLDCLGAEGVDTAGTTGEDECERTANEIVCSTCIAGVDPPGTIPSDVETPVGCDEIPGVGGFVDFGGIDANLDAPIPPLPPGLVAVSEYLEFKFAEDGPPGISGFTLPLTEEITDPSTIAFYTYEQGEWRRVADASVTPDGRAEGEFTSVPNNIAVLKQVP